MSKLGKRILPMLDRILVRRAAPELKSSGGIELPSSSIQKSVRGTVVAVGPGHKNANGEYTSLSVKVGDEVLIPKYGGSKIDNFAEDKNEYVLFRESSILGKVN